VNYLNSDSAVWNDEAVRGALESAALWSKGLPYAKSLSGFWKFLLAPSPENVPENFYHAHFDDSNWEALPGMVLELCFPFSTCFLVGTLLVSLCQVCVHFNILSFDCYFIFV
jgi:hypothetical protein